MRGAKWSLSSPQRGSEICSRENKKGILAETATKGWSSVCDWAPFTYLAAWLLVTGPWHKPRTDSELLQGACWLVKRQQRLEVGRFADRLLASKTRMGTTHLAIKQEGESAYLHPSPLAHSKVKNHPSSCSFSTKKCKSLLLSTEKTVCWDSGCLTPRKRCVVTADTDCSAAYSSEEAVAIPQRESWNLNAVNKKLEEGIILPHKSSGKTGRKLPTSVLKLNPSFIAETKQSGMRAFLARDWITSGVTVLLVHAHSKQPRPDGGCQPTYQTAEEDLIQLCHTESAS